MPPLARTSNNPFELLYGRDGLLSNLGDNPYTSLFTGSEQGEGLLGRALISPQLASNQGLNYRSSNIFTNAFQAYGNILTQATLRGDDPPDFAEYLSRRNSAGSNSIGRQIANSNLRQSGAFARSSQESRGARVSYLSRVY